MAPIARESDATTTDALKSLHQILIDTASGYKKAMEEATEPKLIDLFAGIVSARRKAKGDIAELLQSQGEQPNDEGSFMEAVHRTVIGVRSVMKGIDRDALPAFISGEDNVIKKFDEALTEQQGEPETLKVIEEHKRIAVDQIDAMKRETDD